MARKIKKQKPVLIFVGEGSAEKAFLLHIRSLYANGKKSVKPKSAGGKGPNNVINDALGEARSGRGETSVAALLDLDIPWPPKLVAEAKKKDIPLIGSNPCLEGLLIQILKLKKPTPLNNNSAKKLIHPKLDGSPTDKNSYASLFTKEVLDEAAKVVPELKAIIDIMQ
ncbi:hypothetical protein [Vibrio crassostreae]|uniref:hypothetical protein n=1 Tax=Vibrio crassostreae TaxID=246167 RepID=UPI001BD45E7F|nr:hypothetical protein [Vibrio crassostreae]